MLRRREAFFGFFCDGITTRESHYALLLTYLSEHSAKLTTGPRATAPNAEHATSPNGAELTEPRSINAAGEATLPKKIWGAADSHAGQAGWNRL